MLIVFASVFNNKTRCFQGTQPLELEDMVGEEKKAHIIQRQMLSVLLHHLDTHWSMGPDGIHPRILKKQVEVITETTLHNLFSVLANWGGRSQVGKCDNHLQKGLEGGSRELQTCQPGLGAGEGHGES